MQDERLQSVPESTGEPEEPRPWTERLWRPAGTVVAVGLALLVTWHVVNGPHGLSAWHKMRAEDRDLQYEIQKLEQDNNRLQKENIRLQTDPEAIRHEAREKLHYAGANEIIYTLPASEIQEDK